MPKNPYGRNTKLETFRKFYNVQGTLTGRFSSHVSHASHVRSAFSEVADKLAAGEGERIARLSEGLKRGFELGVCHGCEMALLCVSGKVYEVHRCMECRRTHVYIEAASPVERMAIFPLPRTEQCQAATHEEVFSCPECAKVIK
jgi:hypothetical protein